MTCWWRMVMSLTLASVISKESCQGNTMHYHMNHMPIILLYSYFHLSFSRSNDQVKSPTRLVVY